eukprot:m.279560 g.279560  ORF g.279560 m.279560 type:complete len:449 (+) comp15745_c0_seq3:157-1503(+)
MTRLVALSATLLVLCASAALAVEQVHLAVTGHTNEMGVDFVSQNLACNVTYVKVGPGSTPSTSPTYPGYYSAEIGYLHQSVMTLLDLNTKYQYNVTCLNEPTVTFEFTNQPVREGGMKVAFLADFGLENDVSMKFLVEGAQKNEFDMVILGGDFAYNLPTNHSQVGNDFMNAMQPFTSTRPFMTAPGNHEAHDNFTQYCHRFQGIAEHAGETSGSHSNLFYSWDSGLVHYVAIDTEVYSFFNETQASPYPFLPQEQLDWLESDLKKAQANRAQVPWIIMVGHKGWYMNFEPDQHHDLKPKMVTNFTGFDALADKYKVDLYFTGHVHLYQRFYPLLGPASMTPYERPQVIDKDAVSADGHIYTNPKHMTTIVAGSPGDQEITVVGMCAGDTVLEHLEGTLAKCEDNYGYGTMTIKNATHLYWEWQEHGPGNGTLPHKAVTDYLWLIRER